MIGALGGGFAPASLAIGLAAWLLLFVGATVSAAERPNVVLVVADDLGWSELGCYGNRFHETPHLDRLAADGMRFTQAYAAAPVCSPYRAALLTGLTPARLGITDYLRPDASNGLGTHHTTIAEALREAGYATGMVGKWHLTGYRHHEAEIERRPTDYGFAWNIGSEVKGVGNGANFWPYVFRNQGVRWLDLPQPGRRAEASTGADVDATEYLTDRLNDEAVQFIERHHDEPFFLLLTHYAPHTILNGRPDLVAKYKRKHAPGPSTRQKCYLCEGAGLAGDAGHHWAGHHNPHLAAMLESIDDGIGRIDETLRKHGLAENTIVIFTSDNGGETQVTTNAPLRGGKSQLYEGGIRVPLVVRWPGVVPKGTVCEQPTVNTDFLPTLLAAAGIEHPPVDGVSILPTLKDPEVAPRRSSITWHYPLDAPHFLGGRSSGAIRKGQWKLIEFYDTGDAELYDLADDPGERHDLSERRTEVVAALRRDLAAFRADAGATVPAPPVIAQPGKVYHESAFTPGFVGDRWFFPSDWEISDGVLHRNDLSTETTRAFIRNPEYRDVLVRCDFRFEGAEEIRLMTGTPGHYNAVVHLHPDHFFVQTAADQSVPYFPSILGECAYDFEPNRWYNLTVEIVGDEIAVQIDRDHFVVGRHPILDRQRTYFAFQVDRPSASFDNVVIKHAKRRPDWEARRGELLKRQAARRPVERPDDERLKVLWMNARDRLYRTDATYRQLVAAIDARKADERKRYPDVFSSTKSIRKKLSERRAELRREDEAFRDFENRINRAKRAEVEFLHEREPSLGDLPRSKSVSLLERTRRRFEEDERFVALVRAREQLETQFQKRYAELFVSDAELNEQRRTARKRRNADPEFKSVLRATADAVNAEKDYVRNAVPEIPRLELRIKERESR